MVYRLAGGLFLLLTGFSLLGIVSLPMLIGVTALVAGIALLGGF